MSGVLQRLTKTLTCERMVSLSVDRIRYVAMPDIHRERERERERERDIISEHHLVSIFMKNKVEE